MKLLIPPPLQGFLAGVAIWAIANWLPMVTVSMPWQFWVAAFVSSIGLLIEIVSVRAFFKAKTTINPLAPQNANQLVITGFYRYSRNPMYLGLLLLLIGWAVYLGSL
ncbi:MAG: hypothetical protein KTR16_14520 [Acidiferrobacterales bacterium]|nr:hypothetical protein [Acidiferrobacterales bacterium]